MYKRARAGHISGFTGVNDPYEPPEIPDLSIDASIASPSECAEKLLAAVLTRIAALEGEKKQTFRDSR